MKKNLTKWMCALIGYLCCSMVAWGAQTFEKGRLYVLYPKLKPEMVLGYQGGKESVAKAMEWKETDKQLYWTVTELSGSFRIMNPFDNLAIHTTGNGEVRMAENNGSDESQLWKLESVKKDIFLLVPANKPKMAVICEADGSLVLKDKEAVKANVLKILKETYDITEEDFTSAELEIVPAGKARDCGIDRSMVLAYGQDDRICAFTSLFAMLDNPQISRTACCILVDKEEIGSVGATGMHSRFFENTVAELVAMTSGESELKVRRALQNSKMLSSDVSAAYDPMFASAFEKRSSAFFGRGLVFNKFTGSRGKNGSNDANAEYIAQIRKVMDEAEVGYQYAELGKVDVGGGGTIAYIMAQYGMEVIDSGVAVLCMHAQYEIASKADIYEAVKGYKAFIEHIG